MTIAYPLQWPDGWPRTAVRRDSSPFRTTFDDARRKLYDELEKMGADSVVISSWIPLRLDGHPRADMARRPLADPGIAVYFSLNGRAMVMARDAFRNVHDNLMSVVHAISHLRGLERHGGSYMMQRAFTGFEKLSAVPHWGTVLGLRNPHADKGDMLRAAEQMYRTLAK